MRILAIDDQRQYEMGVHIARTHADGMTALLEGDWDLLYLDHDLGDFSGPAGNELTGHHLLDWLEANPEFLPARIVVVTSNAYRRIEMEKVVRKLGRS